MCTANSVFTYKRKKEKCSHEDFSTPLPDDSSDLLQLLLGAQVVGVSALLLAAIGGTWMQTSIALTANHLVAVVLLGENT